MKEVFGEIFRISSEQMKDLSAGEAWKEGIRCANTNMSKEDLDILEAFEKMLGKTNIEGQLSEIELLEKFVDEQIIKAEDEQKDRSKLYKSLGVIAGIGAVIILI
ncbi:MAG: hypothetical protein HFJ24_04305 [Clostridia bacterium]|nr:hypothetical protein [Clostridia bacterium]MCI9275213.1 hypothetical protein [Clostridia bacterium]